MSAGFRAVKLEQKEERRTAILNAARELFIQSDLKEISMELLSRKSSLAKGTLFFYFKTKEGLFLALAKKEIGKWYKAFNQCLLERRGSTLTIDDLLSLLDLTLQKDSIVVRLFSLLSSTLERNVDFETAWDFKVFLRDNLLRSGKLIENCMPALKEGEGAQVLLFAYVLIIGIYPMSNPPPIVREVLMEPGMEIFTTDFRQTFLRLMTLLLRGMERS